MQALSLDEEHSLWKQGYRRVAGLDEAGRGAWAGPVVAAAVVLPADPAIAERLAGVTDSKLLTTRQRDVFWLLVREQATSIGVGVVPAARIDAIGILPATRQAMMDALAALKPGPDFLLIDHLRLPRVSTPQRSLTRGDSKVLSIAAASIIAKVTRDRHMMEMAAIYPHYGFDRHKGYGTDAHRLALRRYGPCPEHRSSFRPVRGMQLQLLDLEGDAAL